VSASPLVSVAWLAEHRSDPGVRILDIRWYLQGKDGKTEYAAGHIPGSVFVALTDVTAKEGPGRHPIPSAERLTEAMRRAGVSKDTHVIVVDDAGGSIAARLWWLLRVHGHEAVSVLDGGIPEWTAAGHPLVRDVPEIAAGDFVAASIASDASVDTAYVKERSATNEALLLDARARERYRGDREPVDARPGHVPGAKSAPWNENLSGNRFKEASALREHFAALGVNDAKEVIAYCGSGVTACHHLLALEIAGVRGAKLYEGSWSDWARDPTLPAATGD